jgi:hypothetical protein
MNAALTVIKSQKPEILSKTYHLDESGELVKLTSAQMVAGHASVQSVEDLESFADLLVSLDYSDALVYGVPPSNSMDVMTRESWVKAGRPSDKCTRTNEHFSFRHAPGWMFIDYDPHAGSRTLDKDELLQALNSAVPGLLSCGAVWFPSSSSHIFNGTEDLTGLKGQRLYIPIEDASDIQRVGKVIEARLFLAGHGRYDISKSGSLLSRCLIDCSVFQPSRLDFAAGASCEKPLKQKRGNPKIIQGDGKESGFLDSRKVITDLKRDEKKEFEKIRNSERAKQKHKADAIHKAWKEARAIEEATKESDGETPSPEAVERKKKMLSVAFGTETLPADFILQVFENDKQVMVTVEDVLNDPERFDGCRTLDPFEPDYNGGQDCGVLYLDAGNEALHSYAHGGRRYKLDETESQTIVDKIENALLPETYGVELHCKANKAGQVTYYWKQDDGRYVPMTAEAARRGMVIEGCDGVRPMQGVPAPVDHLLHEMHVHNNLAYAGKIAGYDPGIHINDGRRFLSLDGPEVPESMPGDWPILKKLLDGLLPDNQNKYRFIAWIYYAWAMLAARSYRPLPALGLVGPKGSGKSLLVEWMRWLLGNYEQGKAYRFLRGDTSFNAELAESLLLVLDDESASTDMRSRRTLGQSLKGISTCQAARIEGKGIDSVTLRPHWRVVICTNDEPEHIQVLPVIDESTADKILILKCEQSPMPMDTVGDEAKRLFMDTLKAEAPAFLHWAAGEIKNFNLGDGRFPVTGWQDPRILEVLQVHTPEEQLLELIDLIAEDLFSNVTGFWEGSQTELHAALLDNSVTRGVAAKLLHWPRACGDYLSRLSKHRPERVKKTLPIRDRKWRIYPDDGQPGENESVLTGEAPF